MSAVRNAGYHEGDSSRSRGRCTAKSHTCIAQKAEVGTQVRAIGGGSGRQHQTSRPVHPISLSAPNSNQPTLTSSSGLPGTEVMDTSRAPLACKQWQGVCVSSLSLQEVETH